MPIKSKSDEGKDCFYLVITWKTEGNLQIVRLFRKHAFSHRQLNKNLFKTEKQLSNIN